MWQLFIIKCFIDSYTHGLKDFAIYLTSVFNIQGQKEQEIKLYLIQMDIFIYFILLHPFSLYISHLFSASYGQIFY